jgi:hypothetical protein
MLAMILRGCFMNIKIIIVILIISLTFSILFGKIPTNWGIKIGSSISNQTFHYSQTDYSTQHDYRLGVNIGIFAEFYHYKHLNSIVEISYCQKGTEDKDITATRIANNEQGYEDIGYLDLRFDYISFAPKFKLYYHIINLSPYLSIGPGISYLINGNEQVDYAIDNFKKFIIGYFAVIGTEVDFNLPFKIVFEITYSQDITDATKQDVVSVKNHSYIFILGLKF